MWEVEATDEFVEWFGKLDAQDRDAVERGVIRLEEAGPALTRPHADAVRGSQFRNMKELRVQALGRPIRIFYAFDPRRVGVLLIGGDKTGDGRFYQTMIREADRLYAEHLRSLGAYDGE